MPYDLDQKFKSGVFMRKIPFLRSLTPAAVLLGFVMPVSADEMTLAAGAGFRRPLAEVAAVYEKTAGDKILQVYGHMGQVVAQARESGQIAVVCGDQSILREAKDMTFERFARLGRGKLVVAYRKGVTLASAEDIAGDSIKRIGTPDQVNAIYGKAGQQFLERAKLTEKVAPKLMKVSTIPQVTSYIISGEVDAGFINATDALGAGRNIGGFVEVKPDLYDPVDVSCGLVAGKSAKASEGFMTFLATPQAREILTRYGL